MRRSGDERIWKNALMGVGFALIVALASHPATADTPGEDGVDVIYLMRDCTDAGKVLNTDCFEDLASLESAIWGTINPTAANPLVVDIGVGDFHGNLTCENDGQGEDEGHVAFRGVSRKLSRLINDDSGSTITATFKIDGCVNLDFQDLAIVNHTGIVPAGVAWTGGGSSTWSDVELEGDHAAWLDLAVTECTGDPIHYFFGSLIQSGGIYAYAALCGEHWIYGSELRMEATISKSPTVARRGLSAGREADVRLFGSTVLSHPGAGFGGSDDFAGVVVGEAGGEGGGIVHMHGGIISVAANAGDAVGIDSHDETAFAHTLATGFSVRKGTGQSYRVRGDGDLRTPLLRESGTAPPAGGDLSQTGKDMYVETDCDSSGCNGGDDPHLMIYSENCGSDPWFDVVRNACRN